mmetsp:Transcript_60730/g.113511  ORF Transcript_60730/g.113511 Transcript_60730/m.113511 type:complete len:239 (-) Transcript_60730:80-796(-)
MEPSLRAGSMLPLLAMVSLLHPAGAEVSAVAEVSALGAVGSKIPSGSSHPSHRPHHRHASSQRSRHGGAVRRAHSLLGKERSLESFQQPAVEGVWISADLHQQKNSSSYAQGEDTCKEWNCAASTACINSWSDGTCFEGNAQGADIQFDWQLTEPLSNDRKLKFTVEAFKCGSGLSRGQTALRSYDAKGGYQLCSDSPDDQTSFTEFELSACKDATYLYFRTTACEELPKFKTISWAS